MRYSQSGVLDTSFRQASLERDDPFYGGGLVEADFEGAGGEAHDLAIQPNGEIVAVGGIEAGLGPGSEAQIGIARFNYDGSLDPTFGKNGQVVQRQGENDGNAYAVALQPNGRILVGGYHETRQKRTEGLLLRYLPDGHADRSFGSHGEVRFAPHTGQASIHDVAVLPDGKILAVGGFHGEFLLARLLPNGRPDRSFGGGDGRVLTDVDGPLYCYYTGCAYATSLASSHGRILLAGNAANTHGWLSAAARYRPDGRLDRGFGTDGIVRLRHGRRLRAEKMVTQNDGRIVLAGECYARGSYEIAVVRLLPDGIPDRSFGRGGLFVRQVGYESAAYAALVQPDGKVVIGGFAKPRPPSHFFEGDNFFTDAHFVLMRLG